MMAKGYLDLKRQIRKKIATGIYPVGKSIPSRLSIMREFDCARATVDRAINALIEEGVLIGKKGSGTFVQQKLNPKSRKLIYIILHKATEFIETDIHPFLNCLREGCEKRGNLYFITIDDLKSNLEYYISKGKDFVFCQLNPKHFQVLEILKEQGLNILLINRCDPNFDYVSNDCSGSLQKAIRSLKCKTIGSLVEPVCFEYPYRAYYISAYYQAIVPSHVKTCEDWNISLDIQDSAPGTKALVELLNNKNRPEVLFVCAYLLPYLLSIMHLSNLIPGKDLKIIHFDRVPETIKLPGVITLQQDFLTMGKETLNWLKEVNSDEKTTHKYQKLIPAIPLHCGQNT